MKKKLANKEIKVGRLSIDEIERAEIEWIKCAQEGSQDNSDNKTNYNTRQKSWDTLHIFNLDKTFVPLPPLNNVGFWEKYMG